MKIRKARKEDARKISFLKKKTIKKINSKDYSNRVIEIWLEKNNTKNILIAMKKENIFCLWNNKELLGTISFKENKISGLYIKYSEVGKDYGKILMNFIENYAKMKGIKKVVLYSTITAKKFYKKLGYKRVKGYCNKMEKKLK